MVRVVADEFGTEAIESHPGCTIQLAMDLIRKVVGMGDTLAKKKNINAYCGIHCMDEMWSYRARNELTEPILYKPLISAMPLSSLTAVKGE
jgi:hypothetical protein